MSNAVKATPRTSVIVKHSTRLEESWETFADEIIRNQAISQYLGGLCRTVVGSNILSSEDWELHLFFTMSILRRKDIFRYVKRKRMRHGRGHYLSALLLFVPLLPGSEVRWISWKRNERVGALEHRGLWSERLLRRNLGGWLRMWWMRRFMTRSNGQYNMDWYT